jgi:hypothetical protein
MIRVVRTPAGAVQVDPTGRLAGRGAYVCPRVDCWRTALRGSLARVLKTEIVPTDRAALEQYVQALPAGAEVGATADSREPAPTLITG